MVDGATVGRGAIVGGATVGRGAIVGGATVGRGAIVGGATGVCADGSTVAGEHLPSKGLMNLLFLKVMRPEPFILYSVWSV